LAGLLAICRSYLQQHWREIISAEVETLHAVSVISSTHPLLQAAQWLGAMQPPPWAEAGSAAYTRPAIDAAAPHASAVQDGSNRPKRPRRSSRKLQGGSAGADDSMLLQYISKLATQPACLVPNSKGNPHPVYVWVVQAIVVSTALCVPCDLVTLGWSAESLALYGRGSSE
jgi:hypothetical protein